MFSPPPSPLHWSIACSTRPGILLRPDYAWQYSCALSLTRTTSHFLSGLSRVNKERLVLISCPSVYVSVPDLISVTEPLIRLKHLPGKREYCGSWGSKGQVIQSDQKFSVHMTITVQIQCIRTIPIKLMRWRWPSQNTFGMWTVLYWTPSSRTQFGVSINVWGLAKDTLNVTCNFLYCNHQAHRDFLITLYSLTSMNLYPSFHISFYRSGENWIYAIFS